MSPESVVGAGQTPLHEPRAVGDAIAHALSIATVDASDAQGTVCVDVAAEHWLATLRHLRDEEGCDFLDWLSAVDEPGADPPAVDVLAHVVATSSAGSGTAGTGGAGTGRLRRLLVRTRLNAAEPVLDSVTGVWAGAAWHERETHEMFGVDFTGFADASGEGLRPLLLPDGFEGTPLRKSFVLATRAAKPWPGAKEPGESDTHAAPSRRKTSPPGVPDPATWGPRPPTEGQPDQSRDTDA